jgi:hypothetical protein
MAGTAAGEPKGADGAAEMVRALRIARRWAVKARTQAANQLHALLSTAPQRLRESLRDLATKQLVEKASRFRCDAKPDKTLLQQPSSPCAPWPGATGRSPRRSPSSMPTSSG